MKLAVRPVVITLSVSGALSLLAWILNLKRASAIVAGLLIVLAGFDWWVSMLLWRAARRRPELGLLRQNSDWSVLISIAATCLAVVGANLLLGQILPAGAAWLLLIAAVVLLSVAPLLFLIDYYRGRL